MFTAKAYLICAVPPQTPYLLPDPLYLLHAVVCSLKLPLVALESRRIFNAWNGSSLVTPNISYNQSPSFFFVFKVLHKFSERPCFASHIQGEVFLPALCYTVSIHSSLSCRQPVSLPQVRWASYRRVEYEIFNISVWTHFWKDMDCLFLVCKYFIITVFVTTSRDGLKVEKNRIVLRTRSAYLYVLFVWPYYQIDISSFWAPWRWPLSAIFTASDNQKLCGLETMPLSRCKLHLWFRAALLTVNLKSVDFVLMVTLHRRHSKKKKKNVYEDENC